MKRFSRIISLLAVGPATFLLGFLAYMRWMDYAESGVRATFWEFVVLAFATALGLVTFLEIVGYCIEKEDQE